MAELTLELRDAIAARRDAAVAEPMTAEHVQTWLEWLKGCDDCGHAPDTKFPVQLWQIEGFILEIAERMEGG